MTTTRTPDFVLMDHGSVVLLDPMTPAARDWFDEHLTEEVTRWGRQVVVEPRYVANLVWGMEADGLTVQKDSPWR